MARFGFLSVAAIISLLHFALATPATERIRGTIETVTPNSVTIKTDDGATQMVMLVSGTHYASVIKSSLDHIVPGSYIGTAAKTSGGQLIALEVLIFPRLMYGTGEGQHPWDPLPEPSTALPSSTPVASSMTNGSVTSITPPSAPPKVATSMTNGSVQTVSTISADKQISVVYKGGKQIILVPPATPVVTIRRAGKSILSTGAHAFINATGDNGTASAISIAVGADGLTPPM